MAPKTITLAECQEHMSDKDCWLVIEGKVSRRRRRRGAGWAVCAQAARAAWLAGLARNALLHECNAFTC